MALALRNPDKEKNPKGLYTPFTFIDLPGELIEKAYELQGKTKNEIELALIMMRQAGMTILKISIRF